MRNKQPINSVIRTEEIGQKHKSSNLCPSLFLPHYSNKESLTFWFCLFCLGYL